jgi:predicted PurR-regulated permease PerM
MPRKGHTCADSYGSFAAVVHMASPDKSSGVSTHSENSTVAMPTAAFIDLAIRLGLLVLLAYWSLLLVRPFLTVVVWSAVLAVALFPVFDWLAAVLRGRRGLAAALLTTLNLLIVFGPITWLGLGLLETLRVLFERLAAGDLAIPRPFEYVKGWPLIGQQVYELWDLASTNLRAAFMKIAPELKPLGSTLLAAAATASAGILQFVVAVIIAGFLFSSGPSLANAARALSSRIDGTRAEGFVELAGATIRNVSRGVIGISLLQALLAGIGLMVAGVPAAGLITLAVLILGIIQIGPSVILIPVIVWSWITMDMAKALMLTAYLVPVNLLDNVLRPIVLAHGLTTPMPVIFVGVIGGTLAHGVIGLFVGPVVLAVAWELLVAWTRGEPPSAVS